MVLDFNTIFTILFFTDVFIALFYGVLGALININSNRLKVYVVAKLLQASAILFTLLDDKNQSNIAILLSYITAIYGLGLECFSFSFFGLKKTKKKLYVYLAIATVFFIVFALSTNLKENIRIFIAFLGFAILFLISGIDLLISQSRRRIKTASGILLVFIGLISLVYSLGNLYSDISEISWLGQSLTDILAFSMYFLITIPLSISFIFLFKEDDEITIINSHKLFSDILMGIPDEILVFNPDKKILYSNIKEINKKIQSGKVIYCYNIYGKDEECDWCLAHELKDSKRLVESEQYIKGDDKHLNYRHILLHNGNIMTIKKDITEQKRTNQHIKMLSDIVEQSPASIVVTNLMGNIEYVNKAFTSNTGYSYDEAMDKNPRILKSELVNPKVYEQLWDNLTDGKVWNGEFINKKKNGELYYESAIISPTFNDKGEIVNYFAIKQDISDRKKAEQALQESERQLRIAQKVAQIGHWNYDLVNDKLNWSEETYRIFGLSPYSYEPTYKKFLDLIHPDDRYLAENAYMNSLKQKKDYQIIHRILLKSGTIKYVSENGSSTFDKNGNPLSTIGTVQDVTEKAISEQKIKASEELLKKLFSTNPIPVGILDYETFEYVRVNHVLIELLGYSKNELGGKTPATIGQISFKKQREFFNAISTKGQIKNYQLEIKANNGSIINTILFAELIKEENRKLIYITFINITEQNKAQLALKKINLKLQETLEDKEVLLKEVHHRVKNNMQTISSLLFKQQRISNNEKVKSALQDSIDRVASMALINEHIYRNENFREIEFGKHIKTFVQHLVSVYKQPDKTINLNLHTEKVNLSIDKAIPCTLYVNEIITNSLKYAFPDLSSGTITLELLNLDDSMVQFTVSDDGIGLAKDVTSGKNDSIGLFLILNLSERQLQGKLETNTTNGTSYKLTFKK